VTRATRRRERRHAGQTWVQARYEVMNTNPYLSPRIAMFNGAVAILPHCINRPLHEHTAEERKAVIAQAVSTAQEMMKLCDYGESALTITDFKASVVAATESNSPASKPEWIRLPGKGRCPFTGLSRSLLYTLATPCRENGHKPPVRSISLRRKGCARGVRLIHLQSLLDYLKSQEDETPSKASR